MTPPQPRTIPTARARFEGGPRDGRVMTLPMVRRDGAAFGYDAPDEIPYDVAVPDGFDHEAHIERQGTYRRYAVIQPTGTPREQHLYRWEPVSPAE